MNLDAFEGIRQKLNLSTVGKPALIGVAAVLVLVAVVIAGRLFGAATTSEFHVERGQAQQVSAQASGARESSGSSAGQGTPSQVYVHVAGAVAKPGICKLDGEARVADAIEAAGGFAEDALAESVNLARPLVDGEQIIVASREAAGSAGSTGTDAAVAQSAAAGASSQGLVNINVANAAELTALPGVGEATAARIVADRESNGPFKATEDLKRVSGIGDKKFEALRDLICI